MTDLKLEIAQERPFSSLEEEALLNLLRTSDSLQRAFHCKTRNWGLTSTQYNVLRILRGAGTEGLLCREIGCRMISRDPDITRLLDRMESRGLISRTRGEEDRRVVKTRITPEGLCVLEELDAPVQELHRRQLRRLPVAQLQKLSRILDRVLSQSEEEKFEG